MDVSAFDFELPDSLIAQEAAQRGQSRLLVLRRDVGSVEHAMFTDLERYLGPGDLLVLNDTRVFPARLLGRREPSGGEVECLLMGRPRPVDVGDGGEVSRPAAEDWDALVHPGQKLKPGARMVFAGAGAVLHGEVLARRFQGRRTVRLWTGDPLGVGAVVDRIGHVPLPPYIKREDRPEDRERYQTVFAAERGSIAAPTAGLHFTAAQLAALETAGIERAYVTLHVGYGTFKPVRAERVEDHEVDAESYVVSSSAAAALTRARREGRRVIAVGTTTARVLESLAVPASGEVPAAAGETRLFIHPGHQFRLVNGLVTNFHLPRSSLLMLVAAFAGRERLLEAYREAIEQRYRFYSYGDAMLIL
jgi:S-adenosylmethionine:tRNA ribosyltransferase-isomerase